MMDFTALQAPFPAHQVSWRVLRSGKSERGIWARVAPYVEARYIHQRLDDVCGPARWRTLHQVEGEMLLVGLAILGDGGDWVTKWDGTGFVAPRESEDGLSGEDARKATFTVGFRRVSAMWGIGRPLLFVEPMIAQCHPEVSRGRYYGQLKDGTEFSWDPPTLPDWALPGGAGVPPEKPPRTGPTATERANARRARRDAGHRPTGVAPIPCPRCGAELWDNRQEKPGNRKNAADLRCKNRRGCGWAVTVAGWEADILERVEKLQRAGGVEADAAARAVAAAGSKDIAQLHAVECWLMQAEEEARRG